MLWVIFLLVLCGSAAETENKFSERLSCPAEVSKRKPVPLMLTPMGAFLLLRQQMPFPSLNIVSRLRLQHFRSASSHAGEHAQGRRRVGLQLPFPEPRLCGLRDAAGKGLRRCGLITRQKGEEGEKKGGIASWKREEMREKKEENESEKIMSLN